MAAPTVSEDQIKLIRKMWEVIRAGDMQATGVSMYMHMFAAQPEVMGFFSFVPKGTTNPDDLKNNARFLRHAKNLMATVTTAVDKIDDMDTLAPVLVDLGRRHKKYKSKVEHFPIVGRSLTHAVSTAAADAFTPETAEAFSAFYGIVVHYASAGLVEAA